MQASCVYDKRLRVLYPMKARCPDPIVNNQPSTASKEFISGIQAELPILVGVIPFGMIYGALAISAGIPALQAQLMSCIVFAGSAQFVTAQLVHLAAPGLVIFLTVGVVNLRHALYSASLAPFVKHLSVRWKMLLAYLLTDEAYAVAVTHYLDSLPPSEEKEEQTRASSPDSSTAGSHRCSTGASTAGSAAGYAASPITARNGSNKRHYFFLGAGLALWSTWQLSTAAGILIGEVIPDSWSLDFTLALTFIALVAPNLKDRPSLAAALSAGITAVAAASLPYKLGLFLAAIVGVSLGMVLENQTLKKQSGLKTGV